MHSDLDYDAAGNVTARTQRVGGLADAWSYDYDPAGRMVAADGPGTAADASYGWDGASNRISLTVAGATDATVYDTAGLPVSSSGASGSVTYAHDGEGNLTAIDRPGTSTDLELTYDGWGQMVSSRTGGGTGPLTTYGIDPLGRLVTKTTNSTTTAIDHRGLSEDPIRVAEGSTPATTYAWGISGAIATATDGVTRMLVRDLHGDVVAATDAAGALESTHRYTPWGETRAVTDPAEPEPAGTTRLGFQGEPTHAEAGIVDMGIRFYLPVLGRFTTRDVLFGELTSPGSLNQYGYGAANPITFIDPTGMKPCDPSKGRCVHSPYGSSTSGGSMAQAHQNYQAAHPPSSPGSSYASPTATTSRPARPAPPPSPKAPPGVARFRAWMDQRAPWIHEASNAYDVPASVIAGTLATEHLLDYRSWQRHGQEWAAGRLCAIPFVGRHAKCQRLSIGPGQVQVRRAALVDERVKETFGGSEEPGCIRMAGAYALRCGWASGYSEIERRLRNDRLNIHYVGAYLALLKEQHAPGATWATVYGTPTPVGEYNADARFVKAFDEARIYYGYLDG